MIVLMLPERPNVPVPEPAGPGAPLRRWPAPEASGRLGCRAKGRRPGGDHKGTAPPPPPPPPGPHPPTRGPALRVDPDGLPDPVPFFCPARFSGAGERHAQSCGRRRHRVTVSGGGRALTAIGRGRDGGGADLQFTCPDPRAGSGPRAPGPRPRVSGRSAQSRSGGSESAGSAPHGLGRRPNALLAAWGHGAAATAHARQI